MDKVFRRKQVSQLKMSEFQESKQKEIWDVDYYSTSDEEDNDTEEEDNSSSSSNSDNEEKTQDTIDHQQLH